MLPPVTIPTSFSCPTSPLKFAALPCATKFAPKQAPLLSKAEVPVPPSLVVAVHAPTIPTYSRFVLVVLVGRSEPLEHRSQRTVGAAQDQARCRGELRSRQRRAFSSRHEIVALAAGQSAASMHDGPDREQSCRVYYEVVNVALAADARHFHFMQRLGERGPNLGIAIAPPVPHAAEKLCDLVI